jgi:ketosteroid isomerase-like protein
LPTLIAAFEETLANESAKFFETITIKDKDFGFIPDLYSISMGEYADISTWASDVAANMVKIMGTLYRPIDKRVGKKYTIVPHSKANRELVEQYWDAHFKRDWDLMETFFTDDAHYTDVGMDAVGATGGADIIRRLKIGIAPLSGYYHFPKHIVAQGNLVIWEHMERWMFHTGEVVDHPFVSVMQVRDGKIYRWHDYSHIGNIIDNAPQWWLEHIMSGGTNPIPEA